jgi:hypothetical protein
MKNNKRSVILFSFAFSILVATVGVAQKRPDVMIAIPPGQMELRTVGYGQTNEGVGLSVHHNQLTRGQV